MQTLPATVDLFHEPPEEVLRALLAVTVTLKVAEDAPHVDAATDHDGRDDEGALRLWRLLHPVHRQDGRLQVPTDHPFREPILEVGSSVGPQLPSDGSSPRCR